MSGRVPGLAAVTPPADADSERGSVVGPSEPDSWEAVSEPVSAGGATVSRSGEGAGPAAASWAAVRSGSWADMGGSPETISHESR
ncbi:MAG TPA: hypothetical protein VKE74_33120 [Gemmataceae bacterium]|nr:hypothetical protein [Gemmataceae bacterium]